VKEQFEGIMNNIKEQHKRAMQRRNVKEQHKGSTQEEKILILIRNN